MKLYVDQHVYLYTFLSICFKNLMHASTSLLLWWWYDDDNTCSILNFSRDSLKFSEIKLPPASHIIFLGSSYSEKKISVLLIGFLLIGLLFS